MLLVVVYTLLHMCYKYPPTHRRVEASFKKELTGVCRACFSADTSALARDFVAEYKAEYERDLDPEQPTFPKQLSELIDRLTLEEGNSRRTSKDCLSTYAPARGRIPRASRDLRGGGGARAALGDAAASGRPRAALDEIGPRRRGVSSRGALAAIAV